MSIRVTATERSVSLKLRRSIDMRAHTLTGTPFLVSRVDLFRDNATPEITSVFASGWPRGGRQRRRASTFYALADDGPDSIPTALGYVVRPFAPARLDMPPDSAQPWPARQVLGCRILSYEHSRALSLDGEHTAQVRDETGHAFAATHLEVTRRVARRLSLVIVTASARPSGEYLNETTYTVGVPGERDMPVPLLELVTRFAPEAIPEHIRTAVTRQ